MNNKHFIFLFGHASLPVVLGYILMVALAGLLTFLYRFPLVYWGDIVRFSLPFLVIWLGFSFARTRQRLKKLVSQKKIPATTPIEGQLLSLLDTERQQTGTTVRNLRLDQQQQLDHLELFAHEIKNYLAILTATAENNSAVKSTMVKENIRQANYYLDLLLSDERIAMDNNDFAFQWVDLAQLVNTILRQNSALFINKQLIPCLHDIADVTILTDQKWLRFCIEQLLSNAIKYSTDGNTIDISWKINQLQITDHGCGISSNDLPRIYDNGFTGHNGHQTKLSTGMGLYLVKKITRQLNYQLTISSVVNQGTTATLSFDPTNVRQHN